MLKELNLDPELEAITKKDIEFGVGHGTAYSLFVDKKIISIAGVVSMREGIGESWSAPTPAIMKNAIFYFRIVKWGVYDAIDKLNLRRVQTVCRSDDPISYEWQQRLGFDFEGIMKSYNDDGTDAIRMALIWSGKQKTQKMSTK